MRLTLLIAALLLVVAFTGPRGPVWVAVPDRVLTPLRINSVMLWPLVFYKESREDNMPMRVHEEYHWRQAASWGVVPWYAAYLAAGTLYIGRPLNEHPLERPAYAAQYAYEDAHPSGAEE